MSEKKRMMALVLILVVLVGANWALRWSGRGAEGGAFWAEMSGELPAVSPRLQKTLELLQQTPSLSFQDGKRPAATTERGPNQRNPFIFGIDRRLEQERRERMAALEQARMEMEETRLEAQQVIAEAPPPGFEGEILGVLESRVNGEKSLSVLLDGEIIVMNPGDTLKNRLRLMSVDYQRVIFLRIEDGERIEVEVASNTWE